jgi:hypothetical protein
MAISYDFHADPERFRNIILLLTIFTLVFSYRGLWHRDTKLVAVFVLVVLVYDGVRFDGLLS